MAHHEREFLKKDKKKEILKIVYHTAKDKQEKIDSVDEEIIKILTNNARMPITSISKKLKTTPRIIQYRIKELERQILATLVLSNNLL